MCLADERKVVKVQEIDSGVINCVLDSNAVSEMKVCDVLYVLTLGSNLLSVKKLVKDGYRLTFDENDCKIVKNNKLQVRRHCHPSCMK